jgi:hypothetical protein
MPAAKITLEEMAEACQGEADNAWASAAFYRDTFPHPAFHEDRQRRAQVFERAAHIFRLMGTREDRSRDFIVELQKELAG